MKRRVIFFRFFGTILFSSGVILGCILITRFTRISIENKANLESEYLIAIRSPSINYPPATPLPTFTPTPSPTAIPPSIPPIRLSIPTINLNSKVVEISTTDTASSGDKSETWQIPNFVVGHYDTSGNPGDGRNIVLTGHNNTQGEVFRRLDDVSIGDEVILFTESEEFHYSVQKKYIIPFLGDEVNGNLQLQTLSAPQSSEMITIISCWPYLTNANRIVIIAASVKN